MILGRIEQLGRAVVVEALIGVELFLELIIVVLAGAERLLFGGMLGLFAEQGFAILLGDLIIIGMDFRESEEAVTVAAIVDERRLKRRLDPRNLG